VFFSSFENKWVSSFSSHWCLRDKGTTEGLATEV
jgi:hypothetical protein